jgi:hypothetical protein
LLHAIKSIKAPIADRISKLVLLFFSS